MVEIPQYTQRLIAQPSRRTRVNIREPETFRDTNHLERQMKTLAGMSETATNTFVTMKKQRDAGIVNELMNQFTMERNEKLAEFQNKYKGKSAQEIIAAYNDWQEQYLINHMGFSQESTDDTLYLENDEQIEMARNQMRADLPRTINSLSAYAAKELDNYNKNQFSARIQLLIDQGSRENDLNNTQSISQNIAYLVGQQYAGESQEYRELMTRKLLKDMYASNISMDIGTNPLLSIQKLNIFKDYIDPDVYQKLEVAALNSFVENTSTNNANSLFTNGESGNVVDPNTIDIIKPLLNKYGYDDIMEQIDNKTETKLNNLKAKQNEQRNKQNNEFLLRATELIKEQKTADPERSAEIEQALFNMGSKQFGDSDFAHIITLLRDADEEATSFYEQDRVVQEQQDTLEAEPEYAYLSLQDVRTGRFVPKGKEHFLSVGTDNVEKEPGKLLSVFGIKQDSFLVDAINKKEGSKEVKRSIDPKVAKRLGFEQNEKYLTALEAIESNPNYKKVLDARDRIANESYAVSQIFKAIDDGRYKDITSFNIDKLHPANRMKVINYMNSRQRLNNFNGAMEEKTGKAFDFSSMAGNVYKDVTKGDPAKSPATKMLFEDELKNEISLYQEVNKRIPSMTDMKDLGIKAWAKMSNKSPNIVAVYSISSMEGTLAVNIQKETGVNAVNTNDMIAAFVGEINNNEYLKKYDEGTKNLIAEYIVYGNIDAAIVLLSGGK